MLLSAAELANRINHPRNTVKAKVKAPQGSPRTVEELDRNDVLSGPALAIRNSTPGLRPGDTHLSDDVKIPIAVLARLGCDPKEVAETFGVSPSGVRDIADGNGVSEEVKSTVDAALEGIKTRLVDKLSNTVDFITPEKLATAKITDVASVAQRISSVISDLSPKKDDKNQGSKVQVVIHSVNRKDEEHYDVIEVTS